MKTLDTPYQLAGSARGERGVTLIELMVVVVILAIISAVAIPNYTSYVTRSKRAGAKATLLEIAAQMERNYTTNGCYDRTTVADCAAGSGTTYSLPTASTRAPADGKQSYVVAFQTGTLLSQSYTLVATQCSSAGTCPAGSDAGFADAECGNLTLASTGARGISGSGTVANCWQR